MKGDILVVEFPKPDRAVGTALTDCGAVQDGDTDIIAVISH